jgi:hypothetical protein
MQTDTELRAIRDSVAFVGRMSDSLLKVGPFSLGIDGVMAWIPGVGELYSTLAGGFILVQGLRAGAPPTVLAGAAALIFLRTTVSAIPIAGALAADAFTAHKWAAAMIVRAIDRRLGEAPLAPVRPGPPAGLVRA